MVTFLHFLPCIALKTIDFPEILHLILHHGHFGSLAKSVAVTEQAEVKEKLCTPSGLLHMNIIELHMCCLNAAQHAGDRQGEGAH